MLLSQFLDRDGLEEEDDGWLLHCPGHADTKASLRVTVSDKGKILVKCRAGCKTEEVLEAWDLSWGDLIDMTADIVPSHTPAPTATATPGDIARVAARLDGFARALDLETRSYALRRFGVAAELAARLGLGTDNDRLVIPFRDPQGVTRGYQSRALADGARWSGPHGSQWAKLAWFPGENDWDEILITEGPGDGLTAAALGYDAIAIRGASHASNPQVLETVVAWTKGRLVILAGDNDPAGQRFNTELATGIIEAGGRVKFLPIPEGVSDLTAWRERDPEKYLSEVTESILSAPTRTTLGESTDELLAAARAVRDADRYPLTDLGNARFVRDLIRNYGGGVKYSPEGGFFILHHGIWRPDKLDRIRARVQDAADRILEISNTMLELATDPTAVAEAKRWRAWAKYSQSMHGITAALRELQALPDVAVNLEDFDRHHDLLAARNGIIVLPTGELRPHDPALLITKRVEIDYDPNAKAERWEQFLTEVFPDQPELAGYMQRAVGYGITGHTSEQCFVVLWGRGSNGKSTFTDTLTEVFRDITTTTPFSTFEDRASGGIPNDIAALNGSRLVMASEGEQGKPMAEAVLKRVTGQDMITARFMRREFFSFKPTFLIMLASNAKPAFKGQDEGLWRRVKLVPWSRFFAVEERDHTLQTQLRAESQGILTWAVRGATEWYKEGLNDPLFIQRATLEYRNTSDALDGFMGQQWIIDLDARKQVSGKLLYDDYTRWAESEGLPLREVWQRRTFFSALEERGAIKRHSRTGVAFEGVRKP